MVDHYCLKEHMPRFQYGGEILQKLIGLFNGLGWKDLITLFELLCNGQGHVLLGQVAQSLIQPVLEHFSGLGIHAVSGQPVPVPYHLHILSKHYSMLSKHTLFQFKAISPCINSTCPSKKISFQLFCKPLLGTGGCYKISLQSSLIQTESA